MGIDYLFASVALIVQLSGSNLVGSATGFFFQDGTNRYLISNRHVFTGENLPANVPRPTAFLLPLHSNSSNLAQIAFMTLPIVDSTNSPLWMSHPRGKAVDLGAIPLAMPDIDKLAIHWLSEGDIPPDSYGLMPGQDIMVMGFPQGFHDRAFNLPIVRNALASSAYGVPFEGNPYFLVDARLHPGTSGSPVFSKPTIEMPGGGIRISGRPQVFLVGINSGELKPLSGQVDPLGLHVVWYPRLIIEIIRGATNGVPIAELGQIPSSLNNFIEQSGYTRKFFDGP